jgi:hypothetical protein
MFRQVISYRKEKKMTQKDVYVQNLHAKLDEWNAEIDKLKTKVDAAEAEKRAEYQRQFEDLQHKRYVVENKIEKFRGAGEDAWEDLKSGVESAWSSLESAVNSAKSRFK